MKKIAIAAVLAAAMTSGANAATIFNENFEGANPLANFTSGSEVSVANGAIYAACCGTSAGNPNNFAAFDGGNSGLSGSLTKAFTTVLGQIYTIAYSYSVVGTGGFDPLTVSAGGVTKNYNPIGSSSLVFASDSFSFLGTGGAALLSFSTAGTVGADALVDNVSITAVPEASTWAMMIGGFGVVGGAMRRRGRKSAAVALA